MSIRENKKLHLEELKALHLLSSNNVLSLQELEKVLNEYGIDKKVFNNRMKGIEKEYEFEIWLKGLDEVKKFEKFDESRNNIFNSDTTDYKIEMINGKKYYIEIKSKNVDKTVVFDEKYIEDRENVAIKCNSVLIFVVCIYGYWMAFNSEYIKKNNYKIEIKDANNSILYDVFHLQSYMFLSGVKFKTVFSKEAKKQFISNTDYGYLVSEELYFRGKKIYRCKGENSKYILYSICLEALKERMFDMKKNVRRDNQFVIEELEMDYDNNKVAIIQESEMLLSQIFHTVDDDGNMFNPIKEIRAMNDKKEKHYLNISILRSVLKDISQKGLPIYALRDGKIYDNL